jgi:transposase
MLVPVQKESGSSIKSRSQLAKNGNKPIRAKLYMAAITATGYNPDLRLNMNVFRIKENARCRL